MKSLMLKLLTIAGLSILISTNLFGADDIAKKLTSYEKQRISANPQVQLKSLQLAFVKNLDDGWKGYLFKLSVVLQGKTINTTDIIFSNGKQVTADLRKVTGFDYKRFMHPTLSAKYYDKKRLIAGNANAKHKLVVFSDPLCPNCTAEVPDIIKDVKANPKLFSLYYFAFPLDMHPTAKALSKAAMIAENLGQKDVTYRLYTADFEKFFNPYELKDEKKAIDVFNKIFKTNIQLADVNNTKITIELAEDMKMSEEAFIGGTPTIFFDGEVDVMRNKYKEKIK